MNDGELVAILSADEKLSVGYYTGEIAAEQTKALDYYYGRPFGDEVDGMSKVVSRDVAEVIDWTMPDLMRVFMAGDEVVSFEPTREGEEQVAKQATEYANYVFFKDNDGFLFMHDWFKDALLQKIGIGKVYWEDEERVTKETLYNQTVQDIEVLSHDEDVKILEADETQDPEMPGEVSYTVKISREVNDGRVRIEGVPPEEFLITPTSRNLKDARYTAHRTRKTKTELLEMGFALDVVNNLPSGEESALTDSRMVTRYQDEEFSGFNDAQSLDPSERQYWLLEEYARVDFDGDGLSELRQIMRINGTILSNEEIDDHPWVIICPVKMPHKVIGMSTADQTMDIQRIKSVILRQSLNNLYLANSPRVEVPDQAINDYTIDDLLTNTPGGIIRTKAPGMIQPVAVPFFAEKSFPMLEYMDQVRQARTGISEMSQGLSPDILNKSPSGIAVGLMQEPGNGRKEMIARLFAETGVRDLFRKILRLLVKYQDKARMIRLRGEWVQMDPRDWNAEMDVTITVGLGTNNRDKQAQNMMTVMQMQQQAMALGLAGPQQMYNAAEKFLNAIGQKGADQFFINPAQAQQNQQQQQQQQPSPEAMKVQSDAQLNQQKLQIQQQQFMQTQQMKQQQMDQEAGLKKYQIDNEIALKAQQIHAETILDAASQGRRDAVASAVRIGGQPG